MSIDALNDLMQGILSTIQLDGIEDAQSRYTEALPAFSPERRKMQRVFSQLEQDQAGKWSYRLSDKEKIGQAISDHHTTLDALAKR